MLSMVTGVRALVPLDGIADAQVLHDGTADVQVLLDGAAGPGVCESRRLVEVQGGEGEAGAMLERGQVCPMLLYLSRAPA